MWRNSLWSKLFNLDPRTLRHKTDGNMCYHPFACIFDAQSWPPMSFLSRPFFKDFVGLFGGVFEGPSPKYGDIFVGIMEDALLPVVFLTIFTIQICATNMGKTSETWLDRSWFRTGNLRWNWIVCGMPRLQLISTVIMIAASIQTILYEKNFDILLTEDMLHHLIWLIYVNIP